VAKSSEFVVYGDAPHAFFADYRPSYRPADAKDGLAARTDLVPRKRVA